MPCLMLNELWPYRLVCFTFEPKCFYWLIVHLHFDTFCVLCTVKANGQKKRRTKTYYKETGEFHYQSRSINYNFREWTLLLWFAYLFRKKIRPCRPSFMLKPQWYKKTPVKINVVQHRLFNKNTASERCAIKIPNGSNKKTTAILKWPLNCKEKYYKTITIHTMHACITSNFDWIKLLLKTCYFAKYIAYM